MHESQTSSEQRKSSVERKDVVDVRGEPGIANRESPGGMPWESDHPVNLRLSIPLPFKRYYVTIVAGEERRSAQRRVEDRQKHPIKTTANVIVVSAAGTVLGLAIFGAIQLLAIHLMQERHFLVGM
jgi:hypothetical protein